MLIEADAAEGGHQQNVRVEALDWFDSYKAPSDRPRIWQELCVAAPAASGHTIKLEKGRTVIAADVVSHRLPSNDRAVGQLRT
jgi:hypothetical protein